MAGVRITHTTKRSCVLTLVDATRPLSAPMVCGSCTPADMLARINAAGVTDLRLSEQAGAKVHRFKTYHIVLDDQGAAIVSPEVLERLNSMPFHGFQVGNEVKRPPRQIIGPGAAPELRPIQPHETLKEPTR